MKITKMLCAVLLTGSLFFAGLPHQVTAEDTFPIPGHMNNTSEIGVDLGIEELTEPFSPELYYGRTLLSEEGKKAWDLALETMLKYDNSDGKYTVDNSGNARVTVDYEAAGIFPTGDDAAKIQSYLIRNEARMYHIKDWGAQTEKAGNIVKKQYFTVGNGVASGSRYRDSLLQTETAVSALLKTLQDDMTIYQQVRTLQSAYESSVSYVGTGSPGDMRGPFNEKKAICGGYSKGWMYLMHRIGINCIWLEGQAGGYHAWNYVQIEGKWYMMDTTWGGENWYLLGSDYLDKGFTAHNPNQTFAVIPELAQTSVPKNYSSYPSIFIEMEGDVVLLLDEEFSPESLVKSYGNIYQEDLQGSLHVESDVDVHRAGEYTVVAEVSDTHGNRVQKQAHIRVAEGEKQFFGESVNFSLLEQGQEKYYTQGYVFKEKNNPTRTFELPQTENRVFEAMVGIIGSVRQNTAYGSNAKVTFQVEFLNISGGTTQVLGKETTKQHKWKTEAEKLFYSVPQEATHVRITSLAEGVGNNHSGWANVMICGYHTQATSQVTIMTQQPLDRSYTGQKVEDPEISVKGSTGKVTVVYEKRAGGSTRSARSTDSGWERLDSAPVEAGTYRVTAYVEGDQYYRESVSEPVSFLIGQAENSWEGNLQLDNWIYGTQPNQPTAAAKFGEVSYMYGATADGPFTEEVPTEEGIWYVRAVVEETQNYTGLEAVASFRIEKETPGYTAPEEVQDGADSGKGDAAVSGGTATGDSAVPSLLWGVASAASVLCIGFGLAATRRK